MVLPQRRRKAKHQEFLGKKREEVEVCPSYWKTVDPPDRSCHEEDGEELLQREEITPCMDSPGLRNNLYSSDNVKQSNGNNPCQCQCSPAKRRSPFSEKQSLPSSSEEEPVAKRQLLLDEQDQAAAFALRGGYSKIVLPSPGQPPVPGSESPSKWRSSSPSGLAPQQGFSPSGSVLPPHSPLVRTISDASSGVTNATEGSLNAYKPQEFSPSSPTLLPLPSQRRISSNSSNLEGNPNSCKQQGFSFTTSPQPTAMLPPRPPLHRTVSDPTPVAMTTSEDTPNSRRAKRMMHRVKEMSKWFEHIVHQAEAEEQEGHCRPQENIISQPTIMLPPRPPLHCTVSDPTPTPITTVEETPNARRVKSMVQKVKEMGKWFERMVHEAESEEQAVHIRPEESIDCQGGVESDEEAVSVEKVGECLSVQFKCPCGKGYKILLSGKECYYKLL